MRPSTGGLYRPFYTLQYAIGISAASIQADRYLQMLASGYRLPAIGTFRIADIDMTTRGPMESMFRRLELLVGHLEDTGAEIVDDL